MELGNYRSISNISFWGKIVKWLVAKQFLGALEERLSRTISVWFQTWLWDRDLVDNLRRDMDREPIPINYHSSLGGFCYSQLLHPAGSPSQSECGGNCVAECLGD